MADKEKKEIQDLTKKIQELDSLTNIEEIIKDNKIEFEHEGITYRVRQSSPRERREVNEQRMKKYTKLIKDDDYMTKEELKKQYKKKGVNIDGIDSKIKELANQEEKLLKRLAKTTNEKSIKELKDEIAELRVKQNTLTNKKFELLQYSIEELLNDFIETYFCYLLAEKKIDESGKEIRWERAFKSYDDFMDCQNNDLIMKIVYFLSVLIGNQNV